MKKILSLVLLIALTVTALIVPISGAGFYDEYAAPSVLDALTPDGEYKNSVFPDTNPELTPFKDVSVDNWEYNSVYYTYTKKLFYGVTATTFGGKSNITRGQFVTVLGRLAGINPADYKKVSFIDVKEKDFFAPYVEWAAENGIVYGIGGGKFGPNNSATRQDIAAILFRYAEKYTEYDTGERGDISVFPDVKDVSSYAYDAMSFANGAGIINGVKSGGSDYLMPKKTTTRSEMARMISVFDYTVVHPVSRTFTVSGAISSDMVIQRNAEIKVWGFSQTDNTYENVGGRQVLKDKTAIEPGAAVIVEFKGAQGVAFIEEDGSWTATLSRRFPVSAEMGNSIVVYSGFGDERREFRFNDILVGDVYMDFGQSNMWCPVDKVIGDADSRGLDYTIYFDDSDDQAVRLLRASSTIFSPGKGWSADSVTVYDDFETANINWQLPSDGMYDFSALGYVFATELYKKTGVPVGMIQVDASGHPLSSFCPAEITEKYGMEGHPRTDSNLAYIIDKAQHNPENFADCYYVDIYDYSVARWAYNMMINPLLNFNCSGLLWYQGESDQRNTVYYNGKHHAHYAEEFGALMTYLREHFNNDNFPVVFCEYVSCYKYNSRGKPNGFFIPFGVARSENSLIDRYLADSYVAPSADIWYDADLSENIHPYCKPFNAYRMLDIIMARVYGKGNPDAVAGTTLKSVEYNGNSAVLTFNHAMGFTAGRYNEETGKIEKTLGSLYGIEVMNYKTNYKYWTKALSIEIVSDTQLRVRSYGAIYGVRYNADDTLEFGMGSRSNICDKGTLLPIVAFADYGK